MDSAVQPILCCLGQSVGECPTQYLMELGFADRHLDWRAITVEVPTEDLRSAMDGARAMGFRGLRFWGDTQVLASEALGLGGLPVSSALATKSGWQAWHTDGYVLADLVCDGPEGYAAGQSGPLSFALFGDTPLTRRVYAGLLDKYSMTATVKRDVQVNWIGISEDAFPSEPRLQILDSEERLLTAIRNESAVKPVCLVGCSYQAAQALASAVPSQSEYDHQNSDNQSSNDEGATNNALQTEKPYALLPATADAESSGPVCWLPSSDAGLSTRNQDLNSSIIRRISHADLLLSGEQFDFFRWTGQSISLNMLRDAYDEFNAF